MLRLSSLCRASSTTASVVGGALIPYSFVASDMDGTILTPKHVLSDYSKETIALLTQQKLVPFIFATGRLHADVAVVMSHLQAYMQQQQQQQSNTNNKKNTNGGTGKTMERTPLYLITSGGAVIHDALTNTVVRETCVAEHFVDELYALLPAAETRINTHFCQRDRWYCRFNWEEILEFHKESGLTFEVLEKLPPRRSAAAAAEEPATEGNALQGDFRHVSKVFFTSWDPKLLDSLEQLLRSKYGDALTIRVSAHYCIDVTAKGVDKEAALREVLALLPRQHTEGEEFARSPLGEGLVEDRMNRTITFGNDLNDACMLSSTGKGCITANANPRLMEMLPKLEVVKSYEEDGPAQKIREVFDIK